MTRSAPLPGNAIAVFTRLAVKHGLIREGDKIARNMVDFASNVVEICVSIGSAYRDGENGGSAGEHIRAVLGD